MQLAHLPEMVAGDGEGDGQGKQGRASERGPEQQPPVVQSLLAEDAEPVERSGEGGKVVPGEPAAHPGRAVFAQERPDALVVVLRACRCGSGCAGSPRAGRPRVHDRHDVGGAVDVVAGGQADAGGPAACSRSYSRVPGGACSRPTMAVTMPLRWMKSICRWKIEGLSLSKPTMKPPCTCRPARWILFTSATRSRCSFCLLLHSARQASSGVSMPTKTVSKPASDIRPISAGVVGQVDGGLGVEGDLRLVPAPGDQARAGARS